MKARAPWAMALLAALTLTACSWRMETPDPQWPSPDAATLIRDAAAEREQAVIDAATAGSATAEGAVLATIEAADAPARLDALGGVYVAYPDATTSPSPSPTQPSLDDAVTEARDEALGQSLSVDDANLAAILGATGLAHALSAWFAQFGSATAAGQEVVVAVRPLPSDALSNTALVPGEPTAIDAATLSDLALEHDRARYAYEVIAARASEDLRAQWLARRDLQAERAEQLLAFEGVEDQRESVYVLTLDQVADAGDALATAIEVETGLAETYAELAATADAVDRPWLLNAAFDAYAQALAFGPATADAFSVPALPGLITAD
ncbi:DUF4439 domain-containing protein [Demequina sp.]|uniref:DUF4439 domain-containing protein n=1 Tax=Demequina sp. TaxID=2050685 RepID=UPI003A8C47F6